MLTFAVETETLTPLGPPLAADAPPAAWSPTQPERNPCWIPRRMERGGEFGWACIGPPEGVVLSARGTAIGQGLGSAVRLIIQRADAARLANFVVFSDGEAESPDSTSARKHAREAARYLAQHGVDFVSPHGFAGRNVMRDVARITGGTSIDVREPNANDQLAALAGAPIRGIALRNLTTGRQGGTAFPDAGGEFSGKVALAPGENRIELSFGLVGSLGFSRELSVRFEPRAP